MARIQRISSAAYAKSLVIKDSPGKLLSCIGYSKNGGTVYAMLFDSATLPSNGVAEASTVNFLALTGATAKSKYFTLNTPAQGYYVWMNTDSTGVDPTVAGRTGIPVVPAAADDSSALATATATALQAFGGASVLFTATPTTSSVAIANVSKGACTDIGIGSFGVAATVVVDTQGVGVPPVKIIAVATVANLNLLISINGIPLKNGITVALSSTVPYLTLLGTSDGFFTATFSE